MSRLSLLILNGDLPVFPGQGGIEYLQTTGLAKLAHKTGLVSMVHSAQQSELKAKLESYGVVLYLWQNPNLGQPQVLPRRPSVLRRCINSFRKFIDSLRWQPFDTVAQNYQFRNISAPLLQAFEQQTWQAVIVVQSSSARWLDYVPRQPLSVLVMHDIRARLYHRQARIAMTLAGKLSSLLEAWRYRRFERHYCRHYDLVVAVSAEDAAWISQNYRPAQVMHIPIPVDTGYFAPMSLVGETGARILFTGMMNHPPNVDAACYFARQVFPRVQALIPKAEFWIVGRDPAPAVKSLATLPGVVVTGFVKDVRPYMAQATVFVVPLRFGSGMRQKILEVWGMKKCVVSTALGAEGLTYEDGKNILISDDAPTMAAQVVRAIGDPELRRNLGEQGRSIAVQDHNPEQQAHKYYQAISAAQVNKRKLNAPMHVAVDLRWMHPGEAGGIENLSRAFLDQILQLDNYNHYTVVAPSVAKYDFSTWGRRNFRMVAADGFERDWQKLADKARRYVLSNLHVPDWRSEEVDRLCRLNSLNADIGLSMSGYIFVDMYAIKNVLVVPDLQHEYLPELFSTAALQERKRVINDSLRRAVKIVAISSFTRQTVIDRLGIDPSRITTAYIAADPIFQSDFNRASNVGSVLQKYRLDRGDYLFFPAHTWPHKNHNLALQALAILRDTYRLSPLLVLTGNTREAQPKILETIRLFGLDRQVRFLGYCPVEDMPPLYRGAAALVYPSLFEGFGIPILEAMWSDCPVICSNVTSLPEVAGPAAIMIDPQQPEQLADAIYRVTTDEQLRHDLIERGRSQARRFSWTSFTIEVIRTLHEAHSS